MKNSWGHGFPGKAFIHGIIIRLITSIDIDTHALWCLTNSWLGVSIQTKVLELAHGSRP